MLATFGFLEPPELIILLVLVLIIFGPGKLPGIGKSLGKGISEFRKASSQESGEPKVSNDKSETPVTKDEP